MTPFLRFFYTLQHLKFKQLFFRIVYLFYKGRLPRKFPISIRQPNGRVHPFIACRKSLLGPEKFFFLNKSGSLDNLGWDGLQVEKLWRYNQHYFDDLNAKRSSERKQWHLNLLLVWVRENPPGKGVGWESYPTSIRIVNWIKWAVRGNLLSQDCLESLSIQAGWLYNRLEYHILGNHLFTNAKALVFAGVFFQGPESDKWLTQGLNIITSELEEQVLPDGGNFELSPMYHAIFLEDMLDLLNILQLYSIQISERIINDWKSRVPLMLSWLDTLTHPDGEIALFNDAAFGIAPRIRELREYANRLGIFQKVLPKTSKVSFLKDSGYARIDIGAQVVLVDLAKIGPDYLPGHAHADTLSFELSLFGQRVFVNGGTSEYGSGTVRQSERGTAAHNTVTINGENSSEVWNGFRVARRAYPIGPKITEDKNVITIQCGHNGYERFHKGLIHERIWEASFEYLKISDLIKGKFRDGFSYFHFHPDLKISMISNTRLSIKLRDGGNVSIKVDADSVELINGYFSPEFGKRIPNKCLKLGVKPEGCSGLLISWS